jgi:hypothetical protein
VEALDVGDYWATIDVLDPQAVNSPQQIIATLIITIPGDLNRDSYVDMRGFGLFQKCYSGSTTLFEPGCEQADLHQDGVVDEFDFNIFVDCVGGAKRPPGC